MTFDDLSRRTGIEIPPLLQQLLASGPPDLAGFPDFEGLDAEQAANDLDEWLDAKWQDGRRFLPFAQSGAGDAYCLVPLDGGAVGVAFVWHDNEESSVGHGSFADFVCAKFLEAFVDLSYLGDWDLSEPEMAERIATDVATVTAFMDDAETAAYLQALSRQPLVSRPFKTGPRARPEQVPSLMPQAEFEEDLKRFTLQDSAPFLVKARWDIEG